MTNKLAYYQNQKVMFEKLFNCAQSRYDRHYQMRETTEDFQAWVEESNKLRDKIDYYDLILQEIDDVIISLTDIIESEKNIKIYKKRLDKIIKDVV